MGVQKQEQKWAVVDVTVGDEERALGASWMEVCGSILGGGDAAPVLAASARPRCSTRARHQSSPRHPSHRATAPPPHLFSAIAPVSGHPCHHSRAESHRDARSSAGYRPLRRGARASRHPAGGRHRRRSRRATLSTAMTIFPRLLRPIHLRTAQRASTTVAANTSRSYSFFSSKSGSRSIGASTKPPRSVTGPAASKGSSSTASSNPNSNNNTSNDEDGSASSLTSSEDASSANSTTTASSGSSVDPIAQSSPFQPPFQPHHPALSPNDLKLHQFFSLHRPLFLSQPSSSLFESSSTLRLPNSASTPSTGYSSAQVEAEQSSGAFEDPPEASAEADADAARLLARALVINRVGGTIRWDETMRRLGWKGADSKEVLTMSVEMVGGTSSGADMEGENVVDMDSVKRKRRKKMKKHKLKKRRKVCPLFFLAVFCIPVW